MLSAEVVLEEARQNVKFDLGKVIMVSVEVIKDLTQDPMVVELSGVWGGDLGSHIDSSVVCKIGEEAGRRAAVPYAVPLAFREKGRVKRQATEIEQFF
jgi:hypothetical protein